MADRPGSAGLLRIDQEDAGYVALDVLSEPSLIADIESLLEKGESKKAARTRLAACPAALVGSGSAVSDFGEHSAFVAVDPDTRKGCLVLTYGHGEVQERPLEGVRALATTLRKTLSEEASELIGLCGGFGKVRPKIELDVPVELPKKARSRKRAK